MKYTIAGILIILCSFSACVKTSTCTHTDASVTVPAAEIADVQHYLDTSGITNAIQSPLGFFYHISAQGSGNTITNLCTTVTASYRGKLRTGVVIDSSNVGSPISGQLWGFIIGWQKGLPLLNSGGTITLYLPPSLGYGSVTESFPGHPVIPANSLLIFDISVLSYQNQ